MPRPTSKPGPSKKKKAVTIEISSDDDDIIDELVSGKKKNTATVKSEVKRPVGARRTTNGSTGGFGGFVSAFESHAPSESGSPESGPSRAFQSFLSPHLGSQGKATETTRPTTSQCSSIRKGRPKDTEEEPIVMDLGSSPKFPADDALMWESSDSEVKLVSAKIALRRDGKSVAKLGSQTQGTTRGTKRSREGDIKSREKTPSGNQESQTSSMWTDKYAPAAIADLAPSKNRINQVQSWLEESLYGRPAGLDTTVAFSKQAVERVKKYRRILLLTGPAGAGKSTSIRTIAKEMGVEVLEWSEGFEEWGFRGDVERESLTSKLITFLSRNTYSSLPVIGTDASQSPSTPPRDSATSSSRPRLLLITSLPNLSHYPTRQTFHAALLDFSRTYSSNSCPLIVVIPDVGQSGAAEEPWSNRAGAGSSNDGAWDLKSVVGEAVLASPAVTTVDFLSMAPTFVAKALKRVISLAIPTPADRPSNDVVQLIAQSSNGDLRSAVNSLEMLMKTSSSAVTSPGSSKNVLPKKGKGSRGGGKGKVSGSKEMQILYVNRLANLGLQADVAEIRLNQIARREQSLGLFHALGKVLYNKRVGDSTESVYENEIARAQEEEYMRENPLPTHLSQHARPRYENDFEALLSTAPLDTASFMLWMHQNVPQFCADVDEVDQCLEAICNADSMKTDDDLWQRSSQAIAYAFHVAVRGVIAGLPVPVPKNHQKMFKPDFFRWIKAGKANQVILTDTARWLTRADEESHNRNNLDGSWNLDDIRNEEHTYTYRGQRSNAILATEFLPMMRLLKRRGHDVPLNTQDEPFTSLNDNLNDLDILGEKDDGADLSNEPETSEPASVLPPTGTHAVSETFSDDETVPTTAGSYLQDDDIEDDDD